MDLVSVSTGLICLGSFLMGLIVMWIGLYFIAREDKFDATEYAAFLTAFFGGAVISVFTTMTDADTKFLFWVYPIGLFVGLLAYYLLPGQRTLPKVKLLDYESRQAQKKLE